MKIKELRLSARLMKYAANNGENIDFMDVPDEVWGGWSIKERRKIVRSFYMRSNGVVTKEERKETNLICFQLMELLAHKIEKSFIFNLEGQD